MLLGVLGQLYCQATDDDDVEGDDNDGDDKQQAALAASKGWRGPLAW